MRHRQAAAVLAAGGLFGTVAFVGGDEIPEKAPQKLPTAVVNTHELMEIFSEPLYEHLKADMAKEPADKKAWSHIKHHGIEAAEIANLIAIRETDDAAKWDPLARDAQQSGLDLARAAASQDWPKTQAAYQSLIKNCNDCHQAFGKDKAPELEP
ncbi:MAG: cytochrome c [Planctomycetaceae bacterium]|nr:cytochrome c [Planctomycetaceae bacterium]